MSQESDISDKKVIRNGVGDQGNPSECESKDEGVLRCLANRVGHLGRRNISDESTWR